MPPLALLDLCDAVPSPPPLPRTLYAANTRRAASARSAAVVWRMDDAGGDSGPSASWPVARLPFFEPVPATLDGVGPARPPPLTLALLCAPRARVPLADCMPESWTEAMPSSVIPPPAACGSFITTL